MANFRLVSGEEQVLENIRNYQSEVSARELLDGIAYVRSWYACPAGPETWLFAPSKFIGYENNTSEAYARMHKAMDGRQTEHLLWRWFDEVDPTNNLGTVLYPKLHEFLAKLGKAPNALSRISVLKGTRLGSNADGAASSSTDPSSELWRITFNPAILAGKPCIRSMRIRVFDILEMLAYGATRQGILADFPYLQDEDITAAIAFAAETVDVRAVKAA